LRVRVIARIAIIVAQIIARTVARTLTRVQVLTRIAKITFTSAALFTAMFAAVTSAS